jgi:hypothetical protein
VICPWCFDDVGRHVCFVPADAGLFGVRGQVPLCWGCFVEECGQSFDRPALRLSRCEQCERMLVFAREARMRRFCCGACAADHAQRRRRRASAEARRRCCAQCGIYFEPSRADARFCSPSCKQAAYRQRMRSAT